MPVRDTSAPLGEYLIGAREVVFNDACDQEKAVFANPELPSIHYRALDLLAGVAHPASRLRHSHPHT